MLPIPNPHTAYWVLGKKKKGNGTVPYSLEFEEEPPEEYLEQVKTDGLGVYFTVNELGNVRNEKGNLRYKENVISILACFVDLDNGEKREQMKRLDSFLPPSVIVESGRGYHAYWEFQIPLDPRSTINSWIYAQHCIADKLDGDHACSDPARLLRYPGSWHVKENYAPSLVKIVSQNDKRYSLDGILAVFKPQKEKPIYNKTVYRPLKRIPAPVFLTEGTRHAALKTMAGKLFCGSAPIETEERKNALKAWYISSCHPLKENWEQEVEDMVKWVIQKEFLG
jgi:hypothetical protein